jgi:hypothetical protein
MRLGINTLLLQSADHRFECRQTRGNFPSRILPLCCCYLYCSTSCFRIKKNVRSSSSLLKSQSGGRCVGDDVVIFVLLFSEMAALTFQVEVLRSGCT